MPRPIKRREFVQLTMAGSALSLWGPGAWALGAAPAGSKLISPGCRRSKVKVARIYMGGLRVRGWPKPDLDLDADYPTG